MSYAYTTTMAAPFDAAVERVRAALAEEGFGVITEIDVRKTFKTKIGEDFRPYLILGACNPRLAYEALQLEDRIGLMLPCNVVVQALDDGRVEVAAIDPEASMQAADNPALKAKAHVVGEKLQAVIARL